MAGFAPAAQAAGQKDELFRVGRWQNQITRMPTYDTQRIDEMAEEDVGLAELLVCWPAEMSRLV